MIPMFLHRSNGTVLDTAFFRSSFRTSCSPTVLTGLPKISPNKSGNCDSQFRLPPIVREGLIGFRHAVYVFFFLDSCAAAICRVQQFIAQLIDHALFAASARVSHQPADRKRSAPVG